MDCIETKAILVKRRRISVLKILKKGCKLFSFCCGTTEKSVRFNEVVQVFNENGLCTHKKLRDDITKLQQFIIWYRENKGEFFLKKILFILRLNESFLKSSSEKLNAVGKGKS